MKTLHIFSLGPKLFMHDSRYSQYAAGCWRLYPVNYSIYGTVQLFVVHVVSYCRSRSSQREQSKANIVRTICARSLADHVAHTLSLQNITMQHGRHEAMGEGVSWGQLTPNLKIVLCPHLKDSANTMLTAIILWCV